MRFVLASASPARLRLLRDAGFDPVVQVSGLDEDSVRASSPAELVQQLADRKAAAVAAARPADLVLGCDSLLQLDGVAYGKPKDPAEAERRWALMAGGSGQLLTGHCLVLGDRTARGVASTTVHFGRPSPAELAAYVATGEPLSVAGAFTLDGRGAVFVEGVDGDPSNVIGLSLPLLRQLLLQLGLRVTDLWR